MTNLSDSMPLAGEDHGIKTTETVEYHVKGAASMMFVPLEGKNTIGHNERGHGP